MKECPVQVYREMRNAVVTNPEKITHDYAMKLIRRYKEALPDDTARNVVKEYLTRRLEEIRKLADKDIYTRAILLKFMASVMSDPDAYTIESYLEANSRSVPMREMANSVLKHRMQNLLRQTTTKPTEQMLPLNPTNRQHQLLHKLAVEEKGLPQNMRAKPTQKRSFNKAFNNRQTPRKHQKKQHGNNQYHNNSSANAAGQFRQSQNGNKQFAGTQRPTVRSNNKQKFNGGRGQMTGNNSQTNSVIPNNATSKSLMSQQPASSPAQAVAQLKNAYDYSKIADKLDHFGSTTADVQLMLQHQLVQRSIDIAPNPKKPSKTVS